jgi:6-pyruvoyltetrahydropterin/6-carboxytetrahydropterin synthase
MRITQHMEIDAGHRLQRHESKCRNLHGHRYGFDVTCEADALDEVGRVIDFGVVKSLVGGWLDKYWDHGFLVEDGDPLAEMLRPISKICVLSRPPSAEVMAQEVLDAARTLLREHGIRVTSVICHETPNCWAEAT